MTKFRRVQSTLTAVERPQGHHKHSSATSADNSRRVATKEGLRFDLSASSSLDAGLALTCVQAWLLMLRWRTQTQIEQRNRQTNEIL